MPIKILISMIFTLNTMVLGTSALITSKEIPVNIGRSVQISPDDLQIENQNASNPCKVKMITTEPIYQRVGIFEPTIFDCAFRPGSLTYEHLGSPLLTRDKVKFRVYIFTPNGTIEESFTMTFVVQNVPYTLVSVKKNIRVKKFYGVSDPIDGSVIELKARKNSCRAKVSHFQSDWPSYGQLISGRDRKRLDILKSRCEPFLQNGLRYEHLKPPSPNKDFVVILFEDRSGKEHVREWVYVMVKIEPAFPNLQPKPSFVSRLLLEVSDRVLTPLTSDILSARDEETSSEHLIFNVTNLDVNFGHFVHLSDRSQAVFSFRQIDIEKFDIAYQPTTDFPNATNYEIRLVILDAQFLASDPVTLHVVVKPSSASILRASVVKTLILLEGQSAVIDQNHLEVINPSGALVKIGVHGGLKHGQLKVRDSNALSFTVDDLNSGMVLYQHDGSETERDVVHFRVFDDKSSILCKLPISILPVDDDPPVLLVNKEIEVENGTHFELDGNYLKSVDKDTPEDELLFVILESPRLGQLVKRPPTGQGNDGHLPLSNFTQQDVDNGYVQYVHKGLQLGEDSFKFLLEDINIPPNQSPPYIFNIRVVKTDNRIPPAKELSSSLTLSTPENEVAYFDRNSLHYQCVSCRPRDIVYTVKNSPHVIESLRTNEGGRIVMADSALSLEENGALPELFSFTQEQVNHGKVGYVPPNSEIGIYPLKVRFDFSVTRNGEKPPFTGQEQFNIVVLPVNNQPPILLLNSLTTDEGSRTIISSNDISLYDQDTPPSELQLSILTVPLHGSLVRKGRVLRVGDLIYAEEISKLQLQYVHDGSETLEDQIVFALNDGKHFVSSVLKIAVQPIDDEQPKWINGLKNRLEVQESGRVQVSDQYLAAKDEDTNDDDLIFILTLEPTHGWFTENQKRVHRFTQKSVRFGQVEYVHNGHEIGPRAISEQATFIVSDRVVPSMTTEQSVLKLRLVVLPVNNRVPRISVHGSLVVEEGGNVVLSDEVISFTDEDTYLENVTCYVVQQPTLGFLVNIGHRGNNSYEESERSNHHGQLERFTTYDLANRHVLYVQANHSGFEPEYDYFQITASDGVHNSTVTTYMVTITLVPDEPPITTLKNTILVKEGAMAMINSRVLEINDRDFPADTILVSVASQPRFGAIVVLTQQPTVPGQRTSSFTPLDGVLTIETFNVRAFYKHDDSENFKDSFDLTIDDGVFKRIETLSVVITPLDDQAPVLIRNYPVIVKNVNETDSGDAAQVTLSSAYLLAVDDDTPANRLTFLVTPTSLKYGILVLENESTLQVPVTQFTQEDIHSNIVRYLRTNSTSANKEEIEFVVTDEFRNTSISFLEIIFESADSNSSNSNSSNGNTTSTNSSGNYPDPKRNFLKSSVISVYKGGYTVLNEDILEVEEQIKELETLKFELFKPATYGHLESVREAAVPIQSFDYWDLVDGQIIYNQSYDVPNKNSSDTFEIVATLQDSHLDKIRILVNIVDKTPSSSSEVKTGLELLQGAPVTQDEIFAEQMRDFDNLKSKGFLLKYRAKNGGQKTASQNNTLFKIVTYPKYGHVTLHQNGEKIEEAIKVEDLLGQRVAYIFQEMANKVKMTDDLMVLEDTNDGTKYRVQFSWSLLHFTQLYYEACENEGNVPIEITRVGKVDNEVAFVTVEAHARTAELLRDFKPGTTSQLQFDLGIKSVDWILEVINDNQIESNVEQLTLSLSNAVNSLLVYPETAIVNIYDSSCERCAIQNDSSSTLNLVTAADHLRNPFLNEACNELNYGLLQFASNSTQFVRCNGKSWLPWQQNQMEIAIAAPPACEKGWQNFGEWCFKWFKHFLTWSMAQFVCQNQLQAQLVTVQSAEHQEWLNKLAKRPYWIGLYIPKGSLEWSYGGGNGNNSSTTTWRQSYRNFKEGTPVAQALRIFVGFWSNRRLSVECSLTTKCRH